MKRFARTVHHDLPPERARERVTATAAGLGFQPEPGVELGFVRGTWVGQITAVNPKRLRARLGVALRPGEAALELQVRAFPSLLFPQDLRFYETELDALEAALLGRALESSPAQAEREAWIFSWVVLGLMALLGLGGAARLLGLRWF